MQPAYFSATVIALTLILSAMLLVLFQWMAKLMDKQNQMWQTAMNLAASKDLTAFQNLQATSTNLSQPSPIDEPASPLNDAVIAERLAEHYKRAGVDPNLAYSQDDIDFATEFGL